MTEQMQLAVQSRHDIYSFLAELFLTPIPTPGQDYAQRFVDSIEDLTVFADQGEYKEGVCLLKNYQAQAQNGDLEVVQRQLAVDRTKLCRGTAEKEALIPPHEALYLKPEKEMEQLLEIVQLYHKAGLQVSPNHLERMDYIGTEFAFMAELCEKELTALEAKQEEDYEAVLFLENEFLKEHLLKWAIDYCDQVIAHAQTDFFRGFGYLIRAFLNEENELCEYL